MSYLGGRPIYIDSDGNEHFDYERDYEPKPTTNYDRIRAMTDEELAVQLALPYLTSPPWCAEHITCPYINEDITPCDKCALEWLKQEAE